MVLHPFLDRKNPIAFAHRGGALESPENTREAFQHAVNLGFNYLETDARLTADGVPIAFHDARIDRVSNREGAINEMTWDELSELIIHPEQDGGGHLVSFEQLLAEFPETRLNIDAKEAAVVQPLLDVLITAGALDRVCLSSFSDRRNESIARQLKDRGCVGQGPFETIKTVVRGRLGQSSSAARNRPLQIPANLGPLRVAASALIDAAHNFGSAVHVWTVDDPARMHELLDLGVDGIMTDRPSVLRAVLIERGQWHEATT